MGSIFSRKAEIKIDYDLFVEQIYSKNLDFNELHKLIQNTINNDSYYREEYIKTISLGFFCLLVSIKDLEQRQIILKKYLEILISSDADVDTFSDCKEKIKLDYI